MNLLWIRLVTRFGALVFLGFAVVRFWIDYFSSIHTTEEATAGGQMVDHSVVIDHSVILLLFAGLLLLLISLFVGANLAKSKD